MWEKKQEITLIDMMQDSGPEAVTMGEVTLGEYMTEVNQRMIYVFDFFSERAFFIELIEKSDETSPRETPFIANARGAPPVQLALDLLMDESGTDPGFPDPGEYPDSPWLDDLDDDLYDDENPEDL
jgi:hypothetical protein